MAEIVTIFRTWFDYLRDSWKNLDEDEEYDGNELSNDDETNEKGIIIKRDFWTESFLPDEPNLRDLLQGVPTEHDLFEIACTINKFVFFYVLIRGIRITVFVWTFLKGILRKFERIPHFEELVARWIVWQSYEFGIDGILLTKGDRCYRCYHLI